MGNTLPAPCLSTKNSSLSFLLEGSALRRRARASATKPSCPEHRRARCQRSVPRQHKTLDSRRTWAAVASSLRQARLLLLATARPIYSGAVLRLGCATREIGVHVPAGKSYISLQRSDSAVLFGISAITGRRRVKGRGVMATCSMEAQDVQARGAGPQPHRLSAHRPSSGKRAQWGVHIEEPQCTRPAEVSPS